MRVEHVVVRKKQEKVHFLRGTKNDGKASLRGYMHTNWPQQRGSLSNKKGVKKAYRKLFFRNQTRKTTCSRGYKAFCCDCDPAATFFMGYTIRRLTDVGKSCNMIV